MRYFPHLKRLDTLALALLTLLVVAMYADVIFVGTNFYVRDVPRSFFPERKTISDVVHHGEFPFWNARFAGGQPLGANPAYTLFYPGQWPMILSPNFAAGFRLTIILHFLLAGAGMYFFLRSLPLRELPSSLGAVALVAGGLLPSLSSFLPHLYAASWLPWIALFSLRTMRNPTIRNAAATALCFAMVVLVAEAAILIQAAAIVAGFAISRRQWKPIAIGGLIGIAGLVVGVVQIWPTIDLLPDTGRGAPVPLRNAMEWSLPAARALEFVAPHLFGTFRSDGIYYWAARRFYPDQGLPWLFSFYSGLVIAVFAISGFVRRVRGWIAAAVTIALSYLTATGPLFAVLYFSGVHMVRYPEKFIVAGAMALIVIAAIAADQAIDRVTVIASGSVTLLLAAVLVFNRSPLFARVWRLTGYVGDYVAEAHRESLLMLAIAAGLTIVLAIRPRLSNRTFVLLLGALLLVDLAPRAAGIAPRIAPHFYDRPATAPIAGDPNAVRIYSDANWERFLTPQPHLPAGVRPWIGRNGVLPDYQAIWGMQGALEIDTAMMNLRGTREFAAMFLRERMQRSNRVPQLLRMAGVTHVGELIAMDPAVVNDPSRYDEVRPVRFVPLSNARYYFDDPRGRVLHSQESANRVRIDADAASRSVLNIAITAHRYWRATIDGAPAPLMPANIAFQAIVVPAGRHTIEMRYRNPVIIRAGIISLIAAVLLLAALRSTRPLLP